jgi:hypothetical protein
MRSIQAPWWEPTKLYGELQLWSEDYVLRINWLEAYFQNQFEGSQDSERRTYTWERTCLHHKRNNFIKFQKASDRGTLEKQLLKRSEAT